MSLSFPLKNKCKCYTLLPTHRDVQIPVAHGTTLGTPHYTSVPLKCTVQRDVGWTTMKEKGLLLFK